MLSSWSMLQVCLVGAMFAPVQVTCEGEQVLEPHASTRARGDRKLLQDLGKVPLGKVSPDDLVAIGEAAMKVKDTIPKGLSFVKAKDWSEPPAPGVPAPTFVTAPVPGLKFKKVSDAPQGAPTYYTGLAAPPAPKNMKKMKKTTDDEQSVTKPPNPAQSFINRRGTYPGRRWSTRRTDTVGWPWKEHTI